MNGEAMRTHNIGIYEEMTIIIKYALYFLFRMAETE